MLEFDFIIVGAGTSGCMVAAELAMRTDARILLVESGSPTPSFSRRPAEYLNAFGSEVDWALQTSPQVGLAGRSLRWPRGRGVGGSSLINAMIWSPPTATDLKTLVERAGSTWNVESLRTDLREVETLVQPEPPRWLSEAAQRFLQAAQRLTKTLHGEPCVYRRVNRFGRRRTAGDLLQEVIKQRSQAGGAAAVRVLSATVDSILWNGDRAAGVTFQKPNGGESESVSARQGVVICAGTIHSPVILMRSGIGPAELLDDRSIPLRVAREEIGGNLADHLVMPVIWAAPTEARFPTEWSTSDLARWMHGGAGPLTSNLAEVGGFFFLEKPSDNAAVNGEARQVQLHVTPTDYLRHPHPAAPAAITIGVTDCAPRSRGSITLPDSHPHSPPKIEANYFADPRDMATLTAAIRFARRFATESPLAGWCGPERLPGSKRQEDHELSRAVARYAQTLYHPVGTCRLGTDPQAVVSPDFRVRGTESLWVCDGSVLPALPAANPTALIFTLARQLARSLGNR